MFMQIPLLQHSHYCKCSNDVIVDACKQIKPVLSQIHHSTMRTGNRTKTKQVFNKTAGLPNSAKQATVLAETVLSAVSDNHEILSQQSNKDVSMNTQQKRKLAQYLDDSSADNSLVEEIKDKSMKTRTRHDLHKRKIPNRGHIEDVSNDDLSNASTDIDLEQDSVHSAQQKSLPNDTGSTKTPQQQTELRNECNNINSGKSTTSVDAATENTSLHSTIQSPTPSQDYIQFVELKETKEGLNMFLDD